MEEKKVEEDRWGEDEEEGREEEEEGRVEGGEDEEEGRFASCAPHGIEQTDDTITHTRTPAGKQPPLPHLLSSHCQSLHSHCQCRPPAHKYSNINILCPDSAVENLRHRLWHFFPHH